MHYISLIEREPSSTAVEKHRNRSSPCLLVVSVEQSIGDRQTNRKEMGEFHKPDPMMIIL